jgi:hypothetical protein
MSGQPDGPTRYRVRLDAHLATLPNHRARRLFLDREHAKWCERYVEWQVSVDLGDYDGTATAFDFLTTLADIENRRTLYGPAMLGAGQ